jgi:phosphoserine phosphatase RsbU/P
MMSTQQSADSKNNNLEQGKWNELEKLTEQMLVRTDLEGQISYFLKTIERIFSCSAKFWLSDIYNDLIKQELFSRFNINLDPLSELMLNAYQTKSICPKQISKLIDYPSIIAIPLVFMGDVLGIIQLERYNQSGFNNQDVECIRVYCSQTAIVFNCKIQTILHLEQQHKYEMLLIASQLIKPIASNLDFDNLLNNVITSLRQKFELFKVSVLIFQRERINLLTEVCISTSGIEIKKHIYENINGPLSWAINKQESVIINNSDLDDRFPEYTFDINCKSELVIPMISGNSLVGILDLWNDHVDTFGSWQVEIFIQLSDYITQAIKNVKFLHDEQLTNQITERLHETLGRVSVNISYDDMLQKVLFELDRIVPGDVSAIWINVDVTSDRGINQFTSSLRLGSIRYNEFNFLDGFENKTRKIKEIQEQLRIFEEDPQFLLTEYPWLSAIINSKIPIIHQDASPFEPLGSLIPFKNRYSSLGIPLILNDQLLGVIITVNHIPDQYTEDTILLASTFEKYVSVALENNNIFTAANNQVWMTTVLHQITEATQSISSIHEFVTLLSSMLIDLIGVNGSTIYIYDSSQSVFLPQTSAGFTEEQQARLNSFDVFQGTVIAFDYLLDSRNPVILNDKTISDGITSLIFPTYDFQANLMILFPLISQDNFLGAILIDFTNSSLNKNSSQKQWEDMLTLIQGISHNAASTLDNIIKIKSQQEEAYISVALLQVAQAIVSLTQLDEILGAIVRITPILVGVKRCIIHVWDKKEMVFQPAHYFGFSSSEIDLEDQYARSPEYPMINTIFCLNQVVYHQLDTNSSPSNWKNIKHNDIQIIEDLSKKNGDQFSFKLDDHILYDKTRLLIGFPLSVIGEVLGVMLIEEEEPNKGAQSAHIREKRIEIVKGITQLTAIAIKNELLQNEAIYSERMEQELELAREIQRTFLPDHLPSLPGWDLDVRWQPARQVAGDFYDILLLDENRLGIVIADVADKGMPAALFMTLIRTLIRAAAKEHTSPAAVLKEVNELLVPDIKNGMFVTVFYAVINMESGMVKYANAGHNPPVIRHSSSQTLVELRRTSVALGVFDDIEVEEGEVVLGLGDWIFLYTDGVTEAFSIDEEIFGTSRLFELLINNEYSSSKAILDMIDKSIHEFIKGVDLSDDITIAAIINKNS